MAHVATHNEQGGAAEHGEHYMPSVITKSPPEVSADILRETATIGPRYKTWLMITGTLFLVGIAGFIFRASQGFDEFTRWGYFMAGAAFLLTTCSSAPMLSITQRMVRSHWRRPAGRASELFAVVGILATLMLIPMILMLPDAKQRRTIWFDADLRGLPGMPVTTDMAAVIGLAILGLAILWVAALPDLANRRDHHPNARFAKAVAMNWAGTDVQWRVLKGALMVMGGMYFMFLIFVHTIIAADFAESLIPGFKDSIFPTWQALGGLQSAVASTLIVLFVAYKTTSLKEYISVDQFWSAAKIMFSLSLLWAYFWFGGFLIWWYGRQPQEIVIINTLMTQSYRWAFVAALILCFAVPFLTLMWNKSRKSILGPTIAAVAIIIGHLFDKVRTYVSAFNIADLRSDALHTLEPAPRPLLERVPPHWPGVPDLMILVGTIGGAIFIYLLAVKVIPVLSIWELQEGMLYRKIVPFMKRHILLMGKPE